MNEASKLAFSQMIATKSFGVNKLTEAYPVLTGVRQNSLVPLLTNNKKYSAFPFRQLGACGVNICEINANFSNVKFDLGYIECRIPICLEEFTQDFHLFFGEYKKASSEDDLQSAILQFLLNIFSENLELAEWRVSWFADKNNTSPLLNGLNGFFAQMQARPSQVIAIAENSASTFVGQKALTGLQIVGLLEQMYAQYAESAWYETPNVRFEMTRLTASKLVSYMNHLKITDGNCCNGIERVSVDGMMSTAYNTQNLSFLEIPIIVRGEWDGVINDSEVYPLNQGANARVKPHRIVLAARENLVIASSNKDQITKFDTFYDRMSKKVYMEGGSEIGAHIPSVEEFILAI
jgi:hypothetical protein